MKVRRRIALVADRWVETPGKWEEGLRIEPAPGLGGRPADCDVLPIFRLEADT